MTWTPIVGKGFTATEFDEYLAKTPQGDWVPKFVVVHNTAIPTLKEWPSRPPLDRLNNMAHYYQTMKPVPWHAGPHLFVAPDKIWVFTPLSSQGVHSPSWNQVAWGVETVGDFSYEEFKDPQKSLLVHALAGLHHRASIDPHTMRFHKEDPKTTHNCPGKNMHKDELIQLVIEALPKGGEHDPSIDRELA